MPYRRTENVSRRLAARHDAIIAAARAMAREGGMAAVQIAPVAARAGIAAGTVYRYFPAKSDLVAALLTELAERELGALWPVPETPAEMLVASVTRNVQEVFTYFTERKGKRELPLQ